MLPRVATLLVLLLPSAALAQTEHVLVGCDAELRAGIFENSSLLRIPAVDCDEATGGYGAWQARRLSRSGDLVQVETLGPTVELQHECSAGPVALWPYVLRFYAPEDSLVPTVSAPVDTKTRDGRPVRLRPGVPAHHVKGRWYRVQADGEQVEVALAKRQLTTVFGDPPSGACAAVEGAAPPEPSDQPEGAPPGPARYRAPDKSTIFLPTREEVGEVWSPVELSEEQTFVQGLLRCETEASFEWQGNVTGAAPLCFFELNLELVTLEATAPPDPPPTSDPLP